MWYGDNGDKNRNVYFYVFLNKNARKEFTCYGGRLVNFKQVSTEYHKQVINLTSNT